MSLATELLTADEYAALPDAGHPTDLVRGQIIDLPISFPRHGQICSQSVFLLQRFLEDHRLGRVLSNDSGVITERDPDTVRGADIAYYSFARVPAGPMPNRLLSVAPDLVMEVLSQHNRWREVHCKVAEYLRCGVRVVCVLDDDARAIHVFHGDRPAELLTDNAELRFADLLPGFAEPVRRFFE